MASLHSMAESPARDEDRSSRRTGAISALM
jgi:hypothetical protein